MEIHIAHAALADLAVDAIILPCHSVGTLTSAVRDQLLAAGEEGIEAQLKAKAPLAIGAAIIAEVRHMKASSAILVPISKDEQAPIATELLRRAVKAGLTAARIKGHRTLALPSMLAEDATITVAEAARAVAQEIHGYKEAIPESIYMLAPKEQLMRIFEDAVQHAQRAGQSL